MKKEYTVIMTDLRPGSPLFGQQLEFASCTDMTAATDLVDSMVISRTGLTYTYHVKGRLRGVGHLGDWMGKDANGGRARNFFHHENKRNDSNVKDRSLEGDREADRLPQDVLRDRATEQTQPEGADGLHLPSTGSGLTGPAAQNKADRGRTFARNPTFNSTR